MEELVDIYNADRTRSGKTVARDAVRLGPGEYVYYVLGVVQDTQGRYLIVRRAPSKRWAPGSWEVPGGGVSAGEDPRAAIVREMAEEVGLDVSGQVEEPFFTYESVDLAREDNYFVDMYRFVFDVDVDDIVLQEEEADRCAFATRDDICSLAGQGSFLHFERLREALGL